MSTFGSSIGEKKRIILKNPDGTFLHCYKAGERDSIYLRNNNDKAANDNIDALTISDSDLEYIVDNYEQFDQGNIMEEFITVLKRNQVIFFLLLSIELALSMFLLFISWHNKKKSIDLIHHIYKNLAPQTNKLIFYVSYIVGLLITLFFYPLGFYAMFSKKFKLLSLFSNCALVTGILTIFVIYINILFIMLFIMRLVLYTFSRFIANLLISIIVLPRRIQNNQYNTIEN